MRHRRIIHVAVILLLLSGCDRLIIRDSSTSLRSPVTTPGEIEHLKREIRLAFAERGLHPLTCLDVQTIQTIYCDRFSDARAGSVTVWIPKNNSATVHMSYGSFGPLSDPSEEVFATIMSAVERAQR